MILENAGVFLINTIFGLLLYVVMLRVLLQYYKAPYHNPICALSIQATNFIIRPLQKIIPGCRGFDLAGVALFFLIVVVKLFLLMTLFMSTFSSVVAFFVWIIAESLTVIVNFYFFVVLAQVIMSWIQSMQTSPLYAALSYITQPILWPVRKKLPSPGGFDLSPLVVLLALKLFEILVVGYLLALFRQLY